MTKPDDNSDDELTARIEMARLRSERENLHEKVRPLLGAVVAEAVFGRGELKELAHVAREALPDLDPEVVRDIVFHLTDWRADAGCLLALIANPHQFTQNEVRTILERFLVHAPNHVAAAAVLAGNPIQDVFKLGRLVDEDLH